MTPSRDPSPGVEPPAPAAAVAEVPPDLLDTPEAGGRLVRGSLLRTGGYVAGLLLGILVTPFMVRHLGVDDFGRYAAVSSLMFVATGLTEFGVSSIGVREQTNRDEPGRRVLMGDLLGLRVTLSTVAVAGALLFSLISGYSHVMVLGVLVSSLGLYAGNLYASYTVPLAVDMRLLAISSLDLVRQIGVALSTLVLVLVAAPLLPFYVVQGVGALAAMAGAAWMVRRRVSLLPRFHVRRWWPLLRDSIPYAIAIGIGVVYFRVAIVLMSVVASDTETGYFGLAFRIIEIVTGLPWLLVFAAFPILARAARDDSHRFTYALQKLFDVAILSGVGVSLLIALGAPFAVEVIGGSGFDDAVAPLQLLGVAMIGTSLVATYSYALLSRHMHRAVLVTNALALAVGLVLSLVLASAYGAVGAAAATAATELFLALAYIVALVRSDRELRPRLGVVAPAAVSAAAGGGLALALPVGSLVAALVGGAVYLAGLLLLRAVPEELLEIVPLPRRRDA